MCEETLDRKVYLKYDLFARYIHNLAKILESRDSGTHI